MNTTDWEASEGRFIAQFSRLYLETIAGMRSPEQLSRWLGDSNYLALHDARARQTRAKQVLEISEMRPEIHIDKVAFFPGEASVRNCVVMFRWSGAHRALAISMRPMQHRQRFIRIYIIGA